MRNDWYLKGSKKLAEFFIKEYVDKGISEIDWTVHRQRLDGTVDSNQYHIGESGKWLHYYRGTERKLISFEEFEQMFYNKSSTYELW